MLGFLRGLIALSDITEIEQAKWPDKAVVEGFGRIAQNENTPSQETCPCR
jgi:hypothetical protein